MSKKKSRGAAAQEETKPDVEAIEPAPAEEAELEPGAPVEAHADAPRLDAEGGLDPETFTTAVLDGPVPPHMADPTPLLDPGADLSRATITPIEPEQPAQEEDPALVSFESDEAAARVGFPTAEESAAEQYAFDQLPPEVQAIVEHFGWRPTDVASHRQAGDAWVIVTAGGVKLRFPGDEEKAAGLTETQLDGQVRQASHTYPGGYLRRKVEEQA